MLDKSIFKNKADLIDNWQLLDRSELCRKYVDEPNIYKKDAYLSAIIYKFWNVINHNFYKQDNIIAEIEDCYDWIIDAILYVLDHHVWTDPESPLYNDINAPEKAINVAITSVKNNFYVALKRDKRKALYDSLSLDQLSEESSDSYYLPYEDKIELSNDIYYNIIKDYFEEEDYFNAFALDALISSDFNDSIIENNKTYSIFSKRKFKQYMKNLDENYCKIFAKKYNINYNDVLKAKNIITNFTYNKMSWSLEHCLNSLGSNMKLMEAIGA